MSKRLPSEDTQGRVRIYTSDPRAAFADIPGTYGDLAIMEHMVLDGECIRLRVGPEMVDIFPSHISAIRFVEAKESN
ncbi:hypothetical protein [Corynebacterium glutamicum]|uniref:hypothetical protein n=1 Tax=Corynebacterium glutamicum TaxID=1718 RepID=UPI0005C5C5A7|nr:hypothetical protein [Corynebacterium glutamicum]